MPNTKSFLHGLPKLLACVVFLFTLGLPTLQAAKEKQVAAEPAEPPMPLELVPRFLNAPDLRQWKQIERDIQLAEADLKTGEWLLNKQTSAFVDKTRVDADHKKGKAMVDAANAKLPELLAAQNALLAKATAAYQGYQSQFDAKSASIEIKSMPLTNATEDPTEAMLYLLWNQRFSKVLFAGVYVFDNGQYLKSENLSKKLMGDISRYDGNRYTLEEDIVDFTLDQENGRPIVQFIDRETMITKFKPALLIAEVIYDESAPYGIYVLHARDLKTGKLISQTILTFPNDASCKALLKSAPADATAAVDKAADGDAPKIESDEVLKLVLTDETNFLGRLGETRNKYTFTISYVGQIDGFDQRVAILLNKALMRKEGLKVDESEFLKKALQVADENINFITVTNAIWRVSPTSPVKFGMGEYNVQAIDDQSDTPVTVDIGSLSITSAKASTIPPQAAN